MRRRRNRGTWFPTIGNQLIEGPPTTTVSGRPFSFFLESGNIVTAISPVTFDFPIESDFTSENNSLADIIGSEYVLQRLVGKIFAHRFSDAVSGDTHPAIYFGAGFFVARANDFDSGGGSDQPIGSASQQEQNDNYSPLTVENTREPWIWRRTWVLGSAKGRSAGGGLERFTTTEIPAAYPASTALYGSVADGPHLDSRVKRRVSQDNRLWFVVSATAFPIGTTFAGTTSLAVTGIADFRIYGSLRKAKQTSAF